MLTLRKICKDENIDIIHTHLALQYQFYFAALRLIGGPGYLLTLHGSDVNEFQTNNFISKLLIKIGISGADKINSVSKSLADNARKTFNIVTPYIHNGLDIEKTQQITLDFDQNRYEFPLRYFVIVGSFDPYKVMI